MRIAYDGRRFRAVSNVESGDVTTGTTFHYRQAVGRFRDWLGTIVRREVARHWRDTGRRHDRPTDPEVMEQFTDGPADPEWVDAFHAGVLAAAMERCRPRFAPATWEAFVRVWAWNRPPAEVAAELGQTTDWVYVSKSRALKALAEEVAHLTELFPFGAPVEPGPQ